MVGEDGLGLEYGVKFDVTTGAKKATEEIEKLSVEWQKILDKQKLIIRMGVDATASIDSTNTSTSTGNEKTTKAASELKKSLADLELQWKSLTVAQQQGAEGSAIVSKWKDVSEQASQSSKSIKDSINEQNRASVEASKAAQTVVTAKERQTKADDAAALKAQQSAEKQVAAEQRKADASEKASQRTQAAEQKKAEAAERASQRGIAADEKKAAADLATANKSINAAQGIDSQTRAFDNQSRTLSQLRNMALQYLSVYEGIRLIKSIADTTGQFELQRVSLNAILQDADKAGEIFEKVKNLAVVSPFTFMNLISYTKQLAAYRVETDSLYDTMKNLADVSAGLGVDMQRIILAYGQVRAASVLRGQELRQFTEAGIPMVSLLADKFTELEGRVVSTGEVFSKISQRLVPFQMVSQIFSDMTSEGGIFYKMQEIQSETLKGKISNLVDAYQIMFNSIGSSSGVNVVLKGTVDLLMNMAKNWDTIASTIMPVVVILGAYKVVMMSIDAIHKAELAYYSLNQAAIEKDLLTTQRKIALEMAKESVMAKGLLLSKAEMADATASTLLRGTSLTTRQAEIATMTIRNMVLQAGTDVEKINNLQSSISLLLRKEGIAAKEADTMATLILTGATEAATVAQKGFIATLFASNPVGWVMALVAAFAGLSMFIGNLVIKSHALRDELSKIGIDGDVEQSHLISRFEALASSIVRSTDGSKEQIDSLKTLKKVYADILPEQLLTIEGLRELKGNYDEVTKSIIAYIAAKNKEKSQKAIEESIDKSVTPIAGFVKNSLIELKIDSKSAEVVMTNFMTTLEKDGLKGLTPMQLLNKELTNIGLSFAKDANTYSLKLQLDGLVDTYKQLKKQTDELNTTPATGLYLYTKGFKEVQEAIKVAQDKLPQGDLSNYMFDNKKAKLAIDKYTEYLNSIEEKTQKHVSKNKDGKDTTTYTYLGKTIQEDNYKKVIETIQKTIDGLDPSRFEKNVNGIIQKAIDAAPELKKLYNNMFVNPSSEQSDSEYLDNMKKDYDANLVSILKLQDAVKHGGSTITTAGESIDDLNKKTVLQKQILDFYGELAKKEKKGSGGSTVDPRIKSLEDEMRLIDEAKKKYDELIKIGIEPAKAQKTVTDIYAPVMNNGLNVKLAFDNPDLLKQWEIAKGKFENMPKAQQATLKANLRIVDIGMDMAIDPIKKALSDIETEFNKSKKRIELFKNILDVSGGDFDLANRIAKSFDGEGTTSIGEAINKALKDAFKLAGKDGLLNFGKDGNVDVAVAQKAIDEYNKLNPNDANKIGAAMQKQLDMTKDFQEKEVIELFKGLENFKTYEQKRGDIIQKGIEERIKIENLTSLSPEQKLQKQMQSETKQQVALTKNSLDQFKGSDTWATAFGDLSLVSHPVIERLKNDLIKLRAESGDMPIPELSELTRLIDELQKKTSNISFGDWITAMTKDYKIPELIKDFEKAKDEVSLLAEAQNDAIKKRVDAETKYKLNPTEANKASVDTATDEARVATENYTNAVKKATTAENDLTKAQNARKVATAGALKNNDDLKQGFTEIKAAMDDSISAFYAVADAMGIVIDPKTKAILDGITKGLGAVISVLIAIGSVVTLVGSTAWASLAPILIILAPIIAGLAILIGAFAIMKGIKLNGINDQLEVQALIVKNLQEEYTKLEKDIQDALGTDWIADYNKELVNLAQTASSLQKQIDLENSKGKDKDQAKIDEYKKSLLDVQETQDEASKKLQNFVSGTDLSSAAKDFAKSWLDAYIAFGSTTDAMKAKFKDMLNNMVVNTLLAKAMEIALKPVFNAMEAAAADGIYTPDEIAGIVTKTTKATTDVDSTMRLIMDGLKAAGIDITGTSAALTGVSKGISGITEDTAMVLGGYLDSIRFRLFAYLDSKMLDNPFDLAGSVASLLVAQNTQISHLEGIKSNTLRSAVASEKLTEQLDKVTSLTGSRGVFSLNVNT